ncbi:Autophagy-related protein 11 [Phytophthora cactorum]|nr:Autophagy-related protein 11 [Phytophthora cactorum]
MVFCLSNWQAPDLCGERVDLLTLSEECNADDLKKNCVPFLMRHIHEVVRLPAFEEHRVRSSEEVLKALTNMLGPEWEASYAKFKKSVGIKDMDKEDEEPLEAEKTDEEDEPQPIVHQRLHCRRAFSYRPCLLPASRGTGRLCDGLAAAEHRGRGQVDRGIPLHEDVWQRGRALPTFSQRLGGLFGGIIGRRIPMDVARTRSQQQSDEEHKARGDVVVRVGNASTGAVHAVALASANVVVEELREELERLSGVPAADQILLGGPPFARLDPRRAVEYYGLPGEDKEVFLYDRRLLSQEAATLPPTAAALAAVYVELPSQPVASSEGSKMLSESSHPMMRALVSQSEALESGTRANITASERGAQELQVQERAIAAAVANLDLFKTSMMKHFAPFWADFEATSDKHERLLSHGSTPALATEARKTLYDCIPVEKEREWAAQCEQSHTHVRGQVLKLQQVHDEICKEVTDMLAAHAEACREYEEASTELEEMKALGSKQMNITNTLRGNLQYVLSSIEETSTIASGSNPMQASTNALDVCRRIDELYQGQQNMVPDAQKLVEDIVAHVDKIAAKKFKTFERVHSTLRQISISQSKIRDFESSLAVFREALAAQKKHFYELEHLDKLPESYAACLKEISRRLKYGRMFSDRIQSMAEELAQLREDEVQHREEFLRSFGQHLPRDFVSGLAEKPSHCEFRMRPFDQSLPLIEDEGEQEFDPYEDKERPPSDEFVDCEDHGSSSESANNVDLLQERCKELEAQVSELTAELEQSKKNLYYDGSGSESIARSDVSKTSAREGDSSCEFPLVLALAATAGGMTSSTEADRSNILDQELATVRRNIGTDNKDATIAKLEERSKREKQLKDNQSKLQQTIKDLSSSVRSQRASLAKLLKLLQLPVEPLTIENEDIDAFVNANFDAVETRVKELLTSAESAASELEKRRSELRLMESEQDANDSFKISFRSFSVNDLALFLPTSAPGSDAQRVYLAFHLGCPHRFLSEESISSFSNDGQRYPDYVVGRIVLIDEQTATEGNNPYALHLGTTFYVLTVASLHETPLIQTMSAQTTPAEPTTAKRAVEQFDQEFQRYTTKESGKSARAVAMARAELAKYNALVFQDKKLEGPGSRRADCLPICARSTRRRSKTWRGTGHVPPLRGRLQPHQGHLELRAARGLCAHDPWSKHFDNSKDLTYDQYAALEEEPTETIKETVEAAGLSDEL